MTVSVGWRSNLYVFTRSPHSHRCRRSARSITSSRSSAKSKPTRSPKFICATLVTSLNPTSLGIRSRIELALSPPRHSAQLVIFFHFHVAVNSYRSFAILRQRGGASGAYLYRIAARTLTDRSQRKLSSAITERTRSSDNARALGAASRERAV